MLSPAASYIMGKMIPIDGGAISSISAGADLSRSRPCPNPRRRPPMADISGSVAIVTAEPVRAGANIPVVPAAAGPLPDGATAVLINRVDLPGDPVLALRIPPRA